MAKKPAKKIVDEVERYADDVLSGNIIAGRWVKLACQRFIEDRKRKDLKWNYDGALWVFGFFRDVLRLSSGQFEGKPFELQPLQKFIVGNLFGWELLDGRRRFQNAYIEICKGYGKSPLAAGIGHYGLVADNEPRAEIYAAATKKDQAMILFRDAVAMRDQSPQLAGRLHKSGVAEKTWNLADHQSGSWFRPISSDQDSQSGPRPHIGLIDELHEHKSDVVVNMMAAGFKWRRNPLLFMITNSGFDRESVCWRWHDYVARILKRSVENDQVFGLMCALDSCEKHWNEGQEQPVDNCDDCDRWDVEGEHWRKANPNIDVVPGWEYIRTQVRRGLDMPAEENTVRRLNFGYWTSQSQRWLSMQAWDACDKPIDYDALKGRECIIGLDLANKIDIAALVLLFTPKDMNLVKKVSPDGDDDTQYMSVDLDSMTDDFVVLPFFYIPKDNINAMIRRDGVPYDVWVRQGYIEATEGNVIDYQAIKMKIAALKDLYPIRSFQHKYQPQHLAGFDPWNATEFSLDMANTYGVNMIEVRQGFQTMSEPTKEMARIVLAGRLRHASNPVLRWMADNVVVRSDPAGNIKPDKEKSKMKIDGVVALIIALSLAIKFPAQPKETSYFF